MWSFHLHSRSSAPTNKKKNTLAKKKINKNFIFQFFSVFSLVSQFLNVYTLFPAFIFIFLFFSQFFFFFFFIFITWKLFLVFSPAFSVFCTYPPPKKNTFNQKINKNFVFQIFHFFLTCTIISIYLYVYSLIYFFFLFFFSIFFLILFIQYFLWSFHLVFSVFCTYSPPNKHTQPKNK